VQTFLPYPDFRASLECLDYRRLGKQRVEARTILNILEGRTAGRGWRNHPAVLMWRGYESALRLYLNLSIAEWTGRGFRNQMLPEPVDPTSVIPPWWLGREEFHASHRSALLRKAPEHYGRFGWLEAPDLPYWWPTKHLPA